MSIILKKEMNVKVNAQKDGVYQEIKNHVINAIQSVKNVIITNVNCVNKDFSTV